MRTKDPYAKRRDFNPATDSDYLEWPRPLPSFVVRIVLVFVAALMITALLGFSLPDRGIGEFHNQLALAGTWTLGVEQFRWLARTVKKDFRRYRSGETA